MTFERALELDRLRRHEERMSRPVSELFPKEGPFVPAVCKHCGKAYLRRATAGKARGFCHERCRDAHTAYHKSRREKGTLVSQQRRVA